MASIGQKLETKGVVMTLLSLVVINIGCEDKIDSPAVNPSEEKTVEVTLNIGIADETDAYTLGSKSGDTSSDKGAFSYELQPIATSKAGTMKPDKLYNLEVVQYDSNGTYKKRTYFSGETTIGTTLSLTLDALPDCQLVFVAWGNGNTSTTLGTKNLSDAQQVSLDASVIRNIPADNMNTMPYVLHLEHVNVESNTIKSIEGQDVRIQLKRLATRLTLNWAYSYSSYTINQILLESIPANYKVIPKPDETDKTYPSLLDQFTTIKIDPSSLTSDPSTGLYTYSCWIPANVRGTNPAATSQYYRIKSNAPTGSSYASFIAVNRNDAKQKLNYRVYLGGSSTFDYNIHSNTNYSYTVNFIHTGLPVNDRRVTIIDPVPASVNNNNFVPTANCFMVAPGGAFCFNPYKYYANGTAIDNSLLQGWCNTDGEIQSVRVLWQTKEYGDVGDPTLGVVTSETDHTNIVDLANGSDFENARIYCRVAPNTSGGSGVIAAYASADGSGDPLWSWHIWVTEYAPNPMADESVDDPNKRVQKYIRGNNSNTCLMMDRNLGAQAGYTDLPNGDLEKSKANGFHYQFGRKDPFPSTYSSNLGVTTLTVNTNSLTPGMLNYYQPDGFSYYVRTAVGENISIRGSFQHPTTTYTANNRWCTETKYDFWSETGNTTIKTVYDPCPAGWRVAGKADYRLLFSKEGYTESSVGTAQETVDIKNVSTSATDGGVVVYFESEGANRRSTYIRMTGYQPDYNKFDFIGQMTNLCCREAKSYTQNYALIIGVAGSTFAGRRNISSTWYSRDSHPLRCVQDRNP